MMAESNGTRLARRIKSLVIMVLAVVVLIAVQPFLWKKVNGLAEELNQKRFQVKQVNEVKSRGKEIEDEYEKQKIFLEQLTAVVPLSRETLQVIERLEGLASEVGVEVVVESIREEQALLISGAVIEDETPVEAPSISSRRGARETKEEVKKDEPKLLPLVVTIEVRGNPSVLLHYIEAVEHVQELTIVRTLALQSSSVESSSGGSESEYALSMEVIFYLQNYENTRFE
jgi:hypothetical protein